MGKSSRVTPPEGGQREVGGLHIPKHTASESVSPNTRRRRTQSEILMKDLSTWKLWAKFINEHSSNNSNVAARTSSNRPSPVEVQLNPLGKLEDVAKTRRSTRDAPNLEQPQETTRVRSASKRIPKKVDWQEAEPLETSRRVTDASLHLSYRQQCTASQSRIFKTWQRMAGHDYETCIFWQFEFPVRSLEWCPLSATASDEANLLPLENPKREGKHNSVRCLAGTATNGCDPSYVYMMDIAMGGHPTGETTGETTEQSETELPPEDIVVIAKIPHPTDVNCCKMSPTNDEIIASRTTNGSVCIFNWSKYLSSEQHAFSTRGRPPEKVFNDLGGGGRALSWSPFERPLVATDRADGSINIWDINSRNGKRAEATPLQRIEKAHEGDVLYVEFDSENNKLLRSTGSDGYIKMWDTRIAKPGRRAHSAQEGLQIQTGSGACNQACQSPVFPELLASVGTDAFVKLWDVRKPNALLHKLYAPTAQQGFKVSFAPCGGSTFIASSHDDNSIILWDVARIGAEHNPRLYTPHEPELVFQHFGHRSRVTDLAWYPHRNYEWHLLSTDEGNPSTRDHHFMLWRMSERIRLEANDLFLEKCDQFIVE